MNTQSPKRPHLVVLSGAGMSAESGLSTFRDSDGLWAGHDVGRSSEQSPTKGTGASPASRSTIV